jgi:hypothetical protein
MKWAIDCVNHLLPLLNNNINEKIINASNRKNLKSVTDVIVHNRVRCHWVVP